MRKIKIDKNRYVDSVTLMSIGDKVMQMDGVENAEVQMGTPANVEILNDLGYIISDDCSSDDLVFAVTAHNEEYAAEAFEMMDAILNRNVIEEQGKSYNSIDEINLSEDEYNLVQISLPGEYAFEEAKKALLKNLNVFIFSDNVSLDEELELKMLGKQRNLMVMGPDCGVGFIDGVCLGAGSIMQPGEIGIVAASGSGAQEVGCIIEKCGLGISSIIGTGGRDLYPQINGIQMLKGIDVLEKDCTTKVIVLVSKLADLMVMENVLSYADNAKKPVVVIFLGSDESLFEGHKVIPAFSLEEAAIKACEIVQNKTSNIKYMDDEISKIVDKEMKLYTKEQKYFRGIYCGGTFTEEGLIYFSEKVKGVALYSNLSTKYAEKLKDHHKSVGHCILDMGAEDFTSEAPHPVFDLSLRVKRLEQELQDPQTAVVLLDFITGPGVAEDPFTSIVEVIKKAEKQYNKHVTYIANICGTVNDPQNIVEKTKMLKDNGVIVTSCNYESARLAGALMSALDEGGKNE